MQYCLKGWARTAAAFAMILGFTATVQITEPAAFAQTAVTGAINGTVMDATGAIVPNAAVTVKDEATGSVLNLISNSDGHYTATFLKPNKFDISATAPGLQSTTTTVQVLVGHESLANLTVTPSASTQTVQVSANNAQLIDTQTANLTTTFTTAQFQNLPMPGGDITTIAYTVPGVVVNAGGSYGNFSSDGLPGLSNLVIINGADDNDPFLNLNNSGSSNLTLGQQEIAQAVVIQNGYSTQYGRQAGVIESYVTKSGANRVHGLAQYQYNSSGLNANDFFNKQQGNPRPKAVSNQYAAQIGGPIWKNKLFFFADTEGLRYILPTSAYVNYPSAALQNTILNTVPGGPGGPSGSLYATMFKPFQNAATYARATPVINGTGALQDGSGYQGCGKNYAGTPVFGQPGVYFGTVPAGAPGGATAIPCLNAALADGENLNREYLIAGRVDWNVSDRNKLFVRITDDQGQQPSFTSIITPTFNTLSNQPAYSGQINDTNSFTPNLTNQFIVTGLYYSAIFGYASYPATEAASPTSFLEQSDGSTNSFTGIGQSYFGFGITGAQWGYPFAYPQGRNVTQWQIVDDLSWLKGNHNFKFGVNFKRDDVTDTGTQSNTFGGFYYFNSLADYAGGVLPGGFNSSFSQNFSSVAAAHTALYNIGIYAQDEWRATQNVIVDYGIRVDRTGNPACKENCFSHYVGGFPLAGAGLNTPYNQSLSVNHRSAFPSIETAIVQPRVGFNWDTNGQGKNVIRGGIGLFADLFPAEIIANEYSSLPTVYPATILAGTVAQGAGSAPAFAAASAAAFNTGLAAGENYNQIQASLPTGITFFTPNYYTTPHEFISPKYIEYSLQFQHELSATDAIIISYAGNHGYDLTMPNNHLNQIYTGTGTFGGLPATQPDPRFNSVSSFSTSAISNYNGISAEYKHADRHGLTADISYTYSHALDDISNGGTGNLGFNNGSVLSQITPNSVSQLMYSNSDYDIRHNLVGDVTYAETNHFANPLVNLAAGGWVLAGKGYWRSGEPFSVVNTNAETAINNGTGGGTGSTVLADVLNNHFNHSCTSLSKPCFQTPGLFNGSATQNNFGNVPRNAFYGPHYADIDLTALKSLINYKGAQFQVGAQVYNVLNHVNLGQPQNNASVPTSLGKISTDVAPPTSPYGSFQGSTVDGRVLVVQGRLIF